MSIVQFSRHCAIACLSLPLSLACDSLPTLPTPTKTPAATVHSEVAPSATAPAPAPPAESSAPEAVYILSSEKNAPLPDTVEQSLLAVAGRMKASRDLVIRLESYVPNSGSREMNIGLSRQAVTSIQRRLIELGVPSYRIKPSLLGAEHPDSGRLDQRRVELFLLPLPR